MGLTQMDGPPVQSTQPSQAISQVPSCSNTLPAVAPESTSLLVMIHAAAALERSVVEADVAPRGAGGADSPVMHRG